LLLILIFFGHKIYFLTTDGHGWTQTQKCGKRKRAELRGEAFSLSAFQKIRVHLCLSVVDFIKQKRLARAVGGVGVRGLIANAKS
jgi:hypothetical protein